MEINGKCTKDPKIISENFNKFFLDIGKNISDSVTQTVKKPDDYIPDFNPNKPKFSLDNTGPIHVCDIIKTFDNKSSCDLDGLCLKFVKWSLKLVKVVPEIELLLFDLYRIWSIRE